MPTVKKLLWAVLLLLSLPAAGSAQEVLKAVTSQRLEDILTSMKIEFKKGDNGKGVFWYDYKAKNETLRLWNINGKDLMIDVWLPKVDWEVVNKWNTAAKFSRVHLEKDEKGERTVLESNLDLVGGVTEDTIKHFIRNFDVELARWSYKPAPPVVSGAGEEAIYFNVAADRLEKILKDMNIRFTKLKAKGNNEFFYDFERNSYKIRLSNFGGTDLMIDWRVAKALPLAKINEWNVKRNYVRAVIYQDDGKFSTTLESNLDCVAGTSDSIIRYFIEAFDVEVKAFDEHLRR